MTLEYTRSGTVLGFRGQCHQPRINAHTVSVQYLLNGKAYEVQTSFTDGARRPMLCSYKRRDLQGQRSRLQGHVTHLTGVGR